MKKYLSIITFFIVFATTVKAQDKASAFKWVNDVVDFGVIAYEVPVDGKFEFINTGNAPLIIADVQKTCGCTQLDWTKEPIAPGAKGYITAQYDASSEGAFNKALTVNSNSITPSVKIYFKGTVAFVSENADTPAQKTIFN